MTFVEWANAVLPLLALGGGICLVAIYPEVIDAWIARLDAWWSETIDPSHRRRH